MKLARCERIAGIREDLPPNEHVLWQGAPDWRSAAVHIFHVRQVAVYFALIVCATLAFARLDGRPLATALLPAILGVVACALLALLAWLTSRTTIYAITSRRVFLRVGIALPIAINLPLRGIEGAGLGVHADGTGDIPLQLEPGPHLAYLHLWPHARPWRLQRPEPMMRSLPEPERVAGILAGALQASQAHESTLAPAARTAEDAAGVQESGDRAGTEGLLAA